MKLKTLKDIEIYSQLVDSEVVLTKDVKKEAIKWVKHFRKNMFPDNFQDGSITALMTFCNITDAELEGTNSTEEDLK